MSKISAQDFIGTRARFQRLRDAKFFHGWITGFFGNSVEVSTSTDAPVKIGDEFRFEGYGHHISVVFNGRLEEVGELDIMSDGIVTAIAGSNARVLEAKRIALKLTVVSPVRFAASNESVRLKTEDRYTKVKVGIHELEAFTVDVSPNGVGIVLRHPLNPDDCVTASVETPVGVVTGMASVRYCRPDIDRDGFYRVGLMFIDLGRVERPRWERFLKNAH